MKEIVLSNCEKDFIYKTIKSNHRLDGRKNDDFRKVEINFGGDWGSAFVSLGGTKVLCQVICELGEPKATRPHEGMMYINVDLGPMAAPNFEAGRNSDLLVQINRTLERTFKDSKCVDLESLCVMAEEKVWVLRVDLNVINHEGNIIDCCSMAALAALGHFRRPDVSIIENKVHIHTAAEKDPIPLVLHHYPICVTYCTIEEGQIAIADPYWIEERISSSSLIFGLNSYRELCCLNLGGSTLASPDLLLKCAQRAAKHAHNIVEQIKKALESDYEDREKGIKKSFTESLLNAKTDSCVDDLILIKLKNIRLQAVKKEKTEGFETGEDGMNHTSDSSNLPKKSKKKKDKQNKKENQATGSKKPEASNLASWIPDDDMSALTAGIDFEEKSVTEQIEESTRLKNKLSNSSLTKDEEKQESSNEDYNDEEEDVVIL